MESDVDNILRKEKAESRASIEKKFCLKMGMDVLQLAI
jgi:hypothetical protein